MSDVIMFIIRNGPVNNSTVAGSSSGEPLLYVVKGLGKRIDIFYRVEISFVA